MTRSSRRSARRACWGAALLFACAMPGAFARQDETAWIPPPPPEMPAKFDWVRVPSGEWLGGEIKVLYDGSLEFDSDQVGVIKIDWEDVVELRSVQVLQVRPEDGEAATGKVLIKDGKVTVTGDTTVEFDQTRILAMTAGTPREWNYWSGEASGNASYQSGNTDVQSFNARLTIKRRTVEQRIIFDYITNYGETDGDETENNSRLTLDWDRYITNRWFWSPLTAEYFKDKFQNIDDRITIGVGVGYDIIDTPDTEWRLSGGPAYTKTWFRDVAPGESDAEDSPAFQAKTRFDHELTDDLDLWYDYRMLLAESHVGGYSHRMELGAAYEILGDLDLRVSYIWDYISDPSENDDGDTPDKTDTQVLIGVGYSF